MYASSGEKMIENIKTLKEERSTVFIYFIFGLLSLLVALFNTAYLFNPFVMVLLYFAYRQEYITAIVTNFTLILVGFLVNINYGLELSVVCFIFLFLETFSKLLKATSVFKNYLSFIFTNIFVFTIYLVNYPDFFQFLNGLINLFYSYGLLLAFINLEKVINDDYAVFDDRYKVMVISSLSILFLGIDALFIAFFNLVHLVFKKCTSFLVSGSSIVLGAFLLYLFKGIGLNILLISAASLLLSSLVKTKYNSYIYLGSFVLLNILLTPTFYLNGFFYQGILAFLLNLFIKQEWVDDLENIFKRNEDLQVLKNVQFANATRSKVRSIVSYLDCVLDPSLDHETPAFEKAKRNLDASLCSECELQNSCSLNSLKEALIKDNATKQNRQEIIDKCLYPYKLIRRSEVAHDFYLGELSYRHQAEERKKLYQNEIENIYRPLKELDDGEEFKSKYERLKQNYDALHYQIKIHAYDGVELILEIGIEDFDVDKIVDITRNILRKNFYVKQEDDLHNGAILVLSSQNVIEIEKGLCLSSKPIDSGDQIDGFKRSGAEFIVLSDGMGHDKNANLVSSYVIKSLKAYQKLENDERKIIENLNTLVKSKSMHEMYATLDFLKIDLTNKKARIYKSGSFPSYIYRKGKIITLDKIFPPLGIVADLDIVYEDFFLEEEDIIILMSDGFGVIEENFLLENLEAIKNVETGKMADLLYDALIKNKDEEDDKTLCILKVVKSRFYN